MEFKLRNATALPPYTPSNQDCGGRRGASADRIVASQAPCAAGAHEEVPKCDQEAACDTIDLADVRLLFDSVVEEYSCMRDQLKPNAKIVHSLVFEAAVVKGIDGGAMSNAEAAAVKRFEVPRCGSKRTAREEDYATQILLAGPSKRAKNGRSVDDISYSSLLKKLPPTSNVCERFFFAV
ncbi:hypothetical protein PI124_g15684 [Phytophthora idaei]|nr:hypothetical protein PI125_g1940 [Phytophthora idaei]KAG3171725.1 hypothetical protein PI126_g1749 [Phytophthora idaei]KAG3239384.1 hypothetical protein PI124_g15684 [Phytophthora idaei]